MKTFGVPTLRPLKILFVAAIIISFALLLSHRVYHNHEKGPGHSTCFVCKASPREMRAEINISFIHPSPSLAIDPPKVLEFRDRGHILRKLIRAPPL